MEHARTTNLRRRQIDQRLAASGTLRDLAVPKGGWIAEIRGLIGMRAAQLAARLGVTQSAVAQFERAEADGAITLNTLTKVAEALDCRLVYALVPRTSFEAMVRTRAALVALRETRQVSHTMALEDQAVRDADVAQLLGDLTAELIRALPRALWDESR